MIHFAELYAQLDATTRTSEKVDALKSYFQTAPPHDAAWAAFLLLGRKFGRTASSRLIRQWAAEVTGFAPWLIEECNHVAGDFSETLSLLLPPSRVPDAPALHEVIEDHLIPLASTPVTGQKHIILGLWDRLHSRERYVLHKFLGGEFRVGVSRLLVIRALAELAGVERAVMTHRLTGNFQPSAETFAKIMSSDSSADTIDPLLPYPFMLANALDRPTTDLGDPSHWLLEWKWDGIRAQLIRRDGRASLWSRGEEMIAGAFPDLIQNAALLPPGTVLDGEILAWNEQSLCPLPFSALQKRLNRKNVELTFWPDMPLVFMIFDLLESEGTDVRSQPLLARRQLLTSLPLAQTSMLRVSGAVAVVDWNELPPLIDQSRSKRVEGLMLKRWDSPYLAGRPVGPWWKFKVQPFTIDAILVAAQPGRGRRAGLLTDYTFAVPDPSGKLVTICKAYSGLTDDELIEVDRYVRKVSRERFGPVYSVPPERVYEIGFEAIQASDRHKSGIALRFPRILRQRADKAPAQADTVESVRKMLNDYETR
ncbi:MAG: ATP-dependent DNA ligase [Planctomycetota bacterium]|nr:ATP-dependent DNA ligase [Planctomycetota bacterium]